MLFCTKKDAWCIFTVIRYIHSSWTMSKRQRAGSLPCESVKRPRNHYSSQSWRTHQVSAENVELYERGKYREYALRTAARPDELPKGDWAFYPFSYDYGYDETRGIEIKAYGVLPDGHSCCVRMHGFLPYLFVRIPSRWVTVADTSQIKARFAQVLEHLDRAVREKLTPVEHRTLRGVHRLVLPTVCLQKHISAQGFQGFEPEWYAKVFVTYPTLVRHVRIALETPFGAVRGTGERQIVYSAWLPEGWKHPPQVPWSDKSLYVPARGFEPFDANVDFIVRFLTDRDLPASNWWKLSQTHLRVVPHSFQKTLSNVEVTIRSHGVVRNTDPEFENVEPVYIDTKFDIEAAGSKRFPHPHTDPVIQISIRSRFSKCGELDPTVAEHLVNGEIADGATLRTNRSCAVCFCVGSVRPQPGFVALCFPKEWEMLLAFYEFFCVLQPDSLAGHFSNTFDWWYLLMRAAFLSEEHPILKVFQYLGRVPEQRAYNDGNRDNTKKGKNRPITRIPGCWVWDFLNYAQDFLYGTNSYSLNALAEKFLKERQKLDVEYSMIAKMQETEQGRTVLSAYCDRDVVLLEELDDNRSAGAFIREMANVCNIPSQQVLDRQSEFRLVGKWVHRAQRYYDEHLRMQGRPTRKWGNMVRYITPMLSIYRDNVDLGKYKGGSVLTPCPGYFKGPVAVFDFKSLYPTVMIRYNICYLTYIKPGMQQLVCKAFGLDIDKDLFHVPSFRLTADKKTAEAYHDLQNNPSFVRPHILKGLVAHIEEELLAERDAKKALMKQYQKRANDATDPDEKAKWMFLVGKMNLMQLAVKIVCNSMYGKLGMSKSDFPLRDAARTITKMARAALEVTRHWVEENLRKENGYPFNGHVVYGDTDSVFVHLADYDADRPDLPEVERAAPLFPLMQKIAKAITETMYEKPMELEFEKVCTRSYLMTPKCYGLRQIIDLRVGAETYHSGTSHKRRGGCLLQRNLCANVMDQLLEKGSPENAVLAAREALTRVYAGRVEHHELLMRSSLSKPPDQYVNNVPPHVAMAKRIMQEGGRPFKAGDRVYFMVANGEAKSSIADRVQTPEHMISKNLPYDQDYYAGVVLKESRKLLRALLDPRTYQEKREFADWARQVSFEPEGHKQIEKAKKKWKQIQDAQVDRVILHGFDPSVRQRAQQTVIDFSKHKECSVDGEDADAPQTGSATVASTNREKESKQQEQAFSGSGTLHVTGKKYLKKPSIPNNSAFKNFVTVLKKCECCTAPLRLEESGLCENCDCEDNRRIYYMALLREFNYKQALHQSCWMRCATCRGKNFQPEDPSVSDIHNCINYECDNWARRQVATRDVNALAERLASMTVEEW